MSSTKPAQISRNTWAFAAVVVIAVICFLYWPASSATTGGPVETHTVTTAVPHEAAHAEVHPVETPAPAPAAAYVAPGRCEEDMPCWDCELDGNGVCGADVPVAGEAGMLADGAASVRCEEDMACWNASTMGNHVGSVDGD